MGRMSDPHYEARTALAKLMVEVAAGIKTRQFMGRWMFTFYPTLGAELPPDLRRELSQLEIENGREMPPTPPTRKIMVGEAHEEAPMRSRPILGDENLA